MYFSTPSFTIALTSGLRTLSNFSISFAVTLTPLFLEYDDLRMVTSSWGFCCFANSNLPRLEPLGHEVTTKINDKKDQLHFGIPIFEILGDVISRKQKFWKAG